MPATEEQLFELHRLAVAGGVVDVAHDAGRRLSRAWLRVSRFRDVERVAGQSLSVGRSPGVLYDLGWAKDALGDRTEALRLYGEALQVYKTDADRGNEAATLSNIGLVYSKLGEPDRALAHYAQALPILREVGDRAVEAVTRYNIAMIERTRGKLESAIGHLEIVVALDEQTQHPDLASDRAMLVQLKAEAARG